jgi:predicted transcriptional regulator YheO
VTQHPNPLEAAAPAPATLRTLDAESINRVLELLVQPLQAAVPQPTEVVLHDLRRIPNTVRAIAGDVTGRRIGDPPTDKLLERIAAGDFRNEIGYRSQLPDGRVLRSTTIIYTDEDGQAAAALCLNADVSTWVTLRAAMDRHVLGEERTTVQTAPQDSEYFPHSVEELSARLVDAAIATVGVPVPQMRKEHKVQVVAELDRRGFFLIRQAAETAAAALGVTRFTIYNYLNDLGGGPERLR